MRKKQIFLYLGIFFTAVLAMLGIAFGIRQAIRAGNLAGIDWYNTYDKEFVIKTEEELYDLATLSNYYDFAGQTIKLGADIVVNEGSAEDWKENAPSKKWQPITEFAGTFDGQGHSISGLYGKSSSMSMGFFSETKKGCVIKDFKLLNSFFSNSTNNGVGSIMGEGTGKIQKVYSDAIIYGEGESNGGIAGLIKDELKLKECWFDGKVIGEQRSNGGMIGWVDRKADVKIDNCLNSGLIQFIGEGNSKTGGFIGGISDIAYRTDVSQVTIANSLSTGEIDVTNTTMAGAAVGTVRQIGALTFDNTYAVVEVTDNAATEATIGTVNGKLTGNAVPRYRETLIGVGGYQWTNLDFDKYWSCVEGDTPILKCFAEKELSLAGVEKKVDTSWYVEGQTEFVLMDAPDLWGFAMLSANTNFEGVTIKVGADITINDSDSSTWKEKAPEYNWFPIYSFSGTFDGQKHTISGLYVYSNGKRMSFFQQVNANGTIANFKLVNSYVRGSYCIGAVVAQGGGNISNIYTDAVVENTGEHTGGILGAMNQNGTISNCWFDGEVHGGTSYTGGITSASMTAMGVITHCLNTGDVYGGTKHSTGGITGIVNAGATISDTLNAGKVDDSLSSNKNRTGSIIGRIFDSTETTQVTVHISSTYATRESYETSIGQGYQTTGAPAVNSLAELKGNEGYRRTQLNFDKYWAIDLDSHPTLQTFADEIPTLPENVKRPIVADISWFDFDEDVFVINTVEEFYGLTQLVGKNDFEGKTIKLGKNITFNTGNASGWGQSAPLNQWAPLHGFNGTFDGQGHTISGLYMNDGLWKVGLFGNVLEKAVIKNVRVTNSYFEGRYHVAAIAGMATNATVQGVYSDANIVVRKGHGGGIVGSVLESKVDNAWFAGKVTSQSDYIGGITSFITTADKEKNTGSTLSNCLNTGTITGKSNVGGLVGRVAAKGTIKYSLNTGTVTAAKNAGSIVGVVVKDDITSCNIAEGVYATKESAKKTVGNGGGRGAAIVNTTAELTGVGGYQRTILDFDKYWSILETSTPVLKKFGGTPVAIPNVARATAPDTSWYNAKKDTFVLTDYADLYGLAVLAGSNDFTGKTIKLGGNIVANSGNAEDFKTNTPLNQLVPVNGFAGTFDGQGHTISGLSTNNESAWYVGIIGTAIPGASVKNINVNNSYIAGEYHIGSVVGHGTGVTIENVYSDAIMEATAGHLGGIIGTISGESTVSNCWFDGSVMAEKSSYIGGITSFIADGNVTISHCLNTTPIKAKSNAAGIVGRVAGALTLTDSVNTAVINCMSAAGSVVGMITDDGKVTLDAVYGVVGTGGRVVGKGANQSGDSQIIHEQYISGRSGYVYTGLDYNKYWTALDGKTPQLSYFSDKITGEKVSLSGVERKDTSWYDADKKSYVLNDRADLFGFTYLLNSGNTFKGKTVTLGKNIKVNDGDATDWADGKEPLYQWMPIGSYEGHTSFAKAFQGTFDGKMHTISGLYTKNTGAANKMHNWCAGLFAKTGEGAVVKNVEVVNSYFESPYYNGVAGHATGTTIDTVYTDAIIVSTGGNSGGIVGGATESNINNVWFAGSLENAGQFTGGIVGVSNNKVTISNALATGTLQSTTTSNNVYIGGIVGSANGTTLVTDSISVPESITATKKNCIGSVIGGVNKDTKATATNTYALASTTPLTIGQQVKPEEIGPATNRIKVCADLSGLNGYSLTKLDFANYWVALAKKSPELMSFSDGKALAVDTSFRADTKWYTDATVDAAGNAPGTEENPYVIYNKVELYGFAELVNEGITFKGQHVRLGADISVNAGNAASWADEAPDYAWIPIGSYVGHDDYSKSFAGTFDGQDPDTGDIYSIIGLYTKKTGADNNMNNWCTGLFGRTAEGATVKNVKVVNSYFEGSTNNGVIGHATGTTIENIYSDATIVTTGTQNGGIVGAIVGGTIDGAWFDGSIKSANQFVGGIAGLANTDAIITNCLMTGSVKSTYASTNAYAGGLVGCASGNISLTNSVSAAKALTATAKRVGAAIGSANAAGITVTMDDVYVVAGIHKFAVGETFTGTYTEHPWVMPTLNGFNGYTLTKLDFVDKWIAVEGKTPELKALSDNTGLNIADSFRPDTEFAGSGTETDPYVISTKEELYGLAQLVNNGTTFEGQYVVLGADIKVNDGNVEDWVNKAPTYSWTPIGYYNVRTKLSQHFMGTFDGQMHTISGLYMNASKDDVNIGGLFVDTNVCTIKNLKLVNTYFEAAESTGSIAGWYNGGTFDTIYTDAIVKVNKNHPAGIVGLIDEAGTTINNCWFDGQVSGAQYVGGIISYISTDDVTISSCLVTGTITSTKSYTGGIVGDANKKVSIKDSLVACRTKINSAVTTNVGAIAGRLGSTATVSDIYATKTTYDKVIAAGTGNGIKAIEDLSGVKGYLLTTLDFDNRWVAKTDSTPELKSFADGTAANVIDANAWLTKAAGTEADPYVLSNVIELYSFAKKVNAGNDFAGKYVVLGDDIEVNTGNAKNWQSEAPAYSWTPIGSKASGKKFAGNFDGRGYTISGIYASQNVDGIGMFGQIADGSVVRNFKIVNSYFQGKAGVAPVCGWYAGGTFDTIYSDAIVNATSDHAAGILALVNAGTTVRNCWFNGTVTAAKNYVGGITSFVNGSNITISSCLATGTITGLAEVGGLVGRVATATTISDSLSSATVVTTNGSTRKAGIVGWISAGTLTLTNTYAVGDGVALHTTSSGVLAGNGRSVKAENLKGTEAYISTNLDFTNAWVMLDGKAPELKSFATGTIVTVDETWFQAAGTQAEPYVINNIYELYDFAKKVNSGNKFTGKYVVLGADITVNTGTAAEWATKAPAYSWTPIGISTKPFEGHFGNDGEIREIKGLYVNQAGTNFVGFFGAISDGSIKNIKVTNSYISGNQWVGGVVGYVVRSTVDTVYSDAQVVSAGQSLGGIVGNMCSGTINNCWFNGSVTGTGDTQYTGGIVGKISDVNGNTVTNCLATGTVKSGKKTGNAYAGGILGGTTKRAVTINNCLSSVKGVSANGTTACVGSVVGGVAEATLTVSKTYAIKGINNDVTIGTGAANTVISGAVTVVENIKGANAGTYTELDFTTYWVMMKDSVPVLKSFVAADDENIVTPGTWLTESAGTKEDPYIIDTNAELLDFASRVNGGEAFTGKYIVLGADIEFNTGDAKTWGTNPPATIWTPIGTSAKPFKGHFGTNGEIREIKGLYVNQTGTDFVGFFGAVQDGSVKNIKVTNSYFSGKRWVGGVIGYSVRSVIDTLYSDATVVAANVNAGGIVGNMCSGTINNCWFNGSVTGTGDAQYAGGIVGKISDVSNNTVSNCLVTGTVKGGKKTGNAYTGGIIGGVSKKAATITNCLSAVQSVAANGTTACVGSVVGGVDQTTLTVSKTYVIKGINNDVAIGTGASGSNVTGEVTIVENINGGNAVKNTELDFGKYWIMMTDSIPVLKNFVAADDANIRKPDAWFTESQGTKDDPYILVTSAELLDFASRVNGGEAFTGKYVVLGADIEFNTGDAKTWGTTPPANSWTPIGTSAKPFKGHFETKGEIREINGLYVNQTGTNFVGFFGAVSDGSIKNIKVTNSYISGNKWVGGVVGYSVRSVIDTTYSDAQVIAAEQSLGGIVGNMCGGTINNCWFAGTVKGTADKQYTGGIVGKISDVSNNTVTNCLTTGTVISGKTSGNAYAGGILGGTNGKAVTMNNCLSAAQSVTASGTTSCVGSVIGGISNATITASNNYGLKDICNDVTQGTGAAGSNITEKPTIKTKQELQTGYETLLNADYWMVDTSKFDIPVLKKLAQ